MCPFCMILNWTQYLKGWTSIVNQHLPGYVAAWNWLARDVLANSELLLALQYEPLHDLVVAGDDSMPTGVLLRGWHPELPTTCCRLEPADEVALRALLTRIVLPRPARLFVHRPWLDPLLQQLEWLPTGYCLQGYARSTPTPIRVSGRPLGLADEQLVRNSRCGWTAAKFRQMLAAGRQPWAIIEHGRIVCRACTGDALPWSEEILSVWTDPAYRKRGLATSLVAALCNDILRRKPYATYTTTNGNHASQHVAAAVGFTPTFCAVEYGG